MKQGLIIENISNKYKIKTKDGIYMCDARGKLKKDDIKPVVGDRVNIQLINEVEATGVIEKILPRKNYIKRPKIANIDQLILVISSKMPKPDLLMLDKQLIFAQNLGITPIIVINKIDLDKNVVEEIKQEYLYTKYKIIQTNAKEGLRNRRIKKYIKRKNKCIFR